MNGARWVGSVAVTAAVILASTGCQARQTVWDAIEPPTQAPTEILSLSWVASAELDSSSMRLVAEQGGVEYWAVRGSDGTRKCLLIVPTDDINAGVMGCSSGGSVRVTGTGRSAEGWFDAPGAPDGSAGRVSEWLVIDASPAK